MSDNRRAYPLCGIRSSTKLDMHKDIKGLNLVKSKDCAFNGVFLMESIRWQDNIFLINNKSIIFKKILRLKIN